MVESEEVSADGLTWTFKLRDGLKFHDGEPVLAKDVVASITRWMRARRHGADAQGHPEGADRGRRPHLQVGARPSPIPKMLLALGKVGTPCCFIMPERIAKTDPFKQIDEYVGSRPDEVRARRLDARRARRLREVRGLRAAQRAGDLAGRRQGDAASTASSG